MLNRSTINPAAPEFEDIMKPSAQTTFAERIGCALGRTWRGFMRLERKANGWLVTQGMNAVLATGILWAVRLALLGFVLYGAFWVMLLLGFAVVAALASERCIPREDFELQFPTLEELRQMPGYDPNFYDDTSHEMYVD
jgi:hypothetical protein